jgi:D-alanyl-D-alanine carboxypeptidase (penicillin-binding protein 5/6)
MHLTCTHYVSPVGLDSRDISCAYDLAVIGKAILHNRELASIVRRPWDRIPVGYGRTTLLHNRNPLMRSGYPGVDGIKTGHTIPAGWSLVASARRGKHRLIAVLLAEDEYGSDMSHLLDAGFRALKKG